MAVMNYMDYEGLMLYDSLIKAYVDKKIFIGTYAEYQNANQNGEIPVNTLVIITDEITSGGTGEGSGSGGTDTEEPISTTAVLGVAKLGSMKLG